MVSSSRDFGVEQFFRADEFRAVDPSPKIPKKKPVNQNWVTNFQTKESP